jgi:hypothetical protein
VPSQRLPASAQADSSGRATFTWPACPQGSVQTGSVAVAGAGAGSSFTPYLGPVGTEATALATWLGMNPSPTLQVLGQEALTVVGSGLTPGAHYAATFVCDVEPAATAGSGVTPPVSSSTVAVYGIPGAAPVPISTNVDLLEESLAATVTAGAVTQIAVGPVPNAYDRVLVIVTASNATGPLPVVVRNLTADNIPSPPQTFPAPNVSAYGGRYEFTLPVRAGDTLEVDLLGQLAPMDFDVTVNVWGICGGVPPLLRPDGRLRPLNSQTAFTNASGQVAAPSTSSSRILIGTLIFSSGIVSGTPPPYGFGALTVTIGGLPLVIAQPYAALNADSFAVPVGPDGLLCDVNTDITWDVSPVPSYDEPPSVGMLYDEVA